MNCSLEQASLENSRELKTVSRMVQAAWCKRQLVFGARIVIYGGLGHCIKEKVQRMGKGSIVEPLKPTIFQEYCEH